MGNILIVTEIQNGSIRKASYELVSIARKVAEASGREVKSLVIGSGVADAASEFASKGGGETLVADGDGFANYSVDAYNKAIRAAIDAAGADLVLISNTPLGWDVAPRAAAGLDAGYVSDCFNIEAEGDGLVLYRLLLGDRCVPTELRAVKAGAAVRLLF